jgi:hypothetical protein
MPVEFIDDSRQDHLKTGAGQRSHFRSVTTAPNATSRDRVTSPDGYVERANEAGRFTG